MARYHSQHNPKYKKEKLGSCNDSIYNSGCFLVSIANLTNNDPSELNRLFTETGVYSNGCMMNAEKAASRLGYTYKRQTNNPKVRCIAETDHYKSKGVPQHFFLLKPDKSIIDPLDYPADFKKNPYKIVSYRVFTKIDIDDNKNETIPAPVEEVSGDKVEIVEEEPKTPQKPISEATDDTGLKFDWEKQAYIRDNQLSINMNEIMKFLRDKKVITFGWNMLGVFLGILATYLGELDPMYNIILVPSILALTKYINVTYYTK